MFTVYRTVIAQHLFVREDVLFPRFVFGVLGIEPRSEACKTSMLLYWAIPQPEILRHLCSSESRHILNFLFFCHCEAHYGNSALLLDLQTVGVMIITQQKSVFLGFHSSESTYLLLF